MNKLQMKVLSNNVALSLEKGIKKSFSDPTEKDFTSS